MPQFANRSASDAPAARRSLVIPWERNGADFAGNRGWRGIYRLKPRWFPGTIPRLAGQMAQVARAVPSRGGE